MENTADVPDEQFLKIIAVTRLALPHSGIVLSTREDAQLRTSLLRQGTGVTHMSAGSCTGPGGYAVCPEEAGAQFDILDRRPLKEVMEEAARLGYEPELGVSGFGI